MMTTQSLISTGTLSVTGYVQDHPCEIESDIVQQNINIVKVLQ